METINVDELVSRLSTPAFEDDHRMVARMGEVTHIYLYGEITEPIDYVPEIKALNLATEHETIYIHINSYGGLMTSAVSFVNAIKRCKANVIAVCDVAMSAATIITLACNEVEYSEYTEFMIHDISAGTYGNSRDQKVVTEHYAKYFKQFLIDAYAGFLDEEEVIQFIKDGNDWYMTGTELIERFDKWSDKTTRIATFN